MTKKSNQDNFTETTRRQLWERAGSRCSNPHCKILTSASNRDSLDKSVRVGHGAHITAASSDGPRYDKSLTSAQRKHYDNGIWCCYNCGHRIDTEFKTFTVEQLKQWKREAEQSIVMGLNKPYYTELEHKEETQK